MEQWPPDSNTVRLLRLGHKLERAVEWRSRSASAIVADAQRSNGTPNVFSDPVAVYRSFRPARPGEVGDRNVLRAPGYISLDMGLYKSFKIPGRSCAAVPLGGLQRHQHAAV